MDLMDRKRYTYADYVGWPDNERWELIDGVPYDLTPTPPADHQRVLGRLMSPLANLLDGKPCKVLFGPLDVFFPSSADQALGDIETVVQPDILVMCDPAGNIPEGYRGAPELVIEIVSPWTAQRDLKQKFDLYEREGVREYWVVDPAHLYVRVFTLSADGYYGEGVLTVHFGEAESHIIEGYSVNLDTLFDGLFSTPGRPESPIDMSRFRRI
jgi:Uma2 family endonuclease